jgi:hypothetical protein
VVRVALKTVCALITVATWAGLRRQVSDRSLHSHWSGLKIEVWVVVNQALGNSARHLLEVGRINLTGQVVATCNELSVLKLRATNSLIEDVPALLKRESI